MKTRHLGARWMHGGTLIAMFATTAALAGGAQALAPASAAALTNEGNECANLEWTWQVVDCELNHGGGGPGGGGGGVATTPGSTGTGANSSCSLSTDDNVCSIDDSDTQGPRPEYDGSGGTPDPPSVSSPDPDGLERLLERHRQRRCAIARAGVSRTRSHLSRLRHLRGGASPDDGARELSRLKEDLATYWTAWELDSCEAE